MSDKYAFSLPAKSLIILSTGFAVLMACVGFRITRSPELALETAHIQLNVSSNAKKLKATSVQLEEQARLIEAKDEAYQELLTVYQQSLKGKQGYGKLQRAIEDIEALPESENIEELTEQVEQVEEDIELITVE